MGCPGGISRFRMTAENLCCGWVIWLAAAVYPRRVLGNSKIRIIILRVEMAL